MPQSLPYLAHVQVMTAFSHATGVIMSIAILLPALGIGIAMIISAAKGHAQVKINVNLGRSPRDPP